MKARVLGIGVAILVSGLTAAAQPRAFTPAPDAVKKCVGRRAAELMELLRNARTNAEINRYKRETPTVIEKACRASLTSAERTVAIGEGLHKWSAQSPKPGARWTPPFTVPPPCAAAIGRISQKDVMLTSNRDMAAKLQKAGC